MSSSSSQTPGPAAKRRRVDAANATLRKPFRSPMIRGPSASTPGQETTPCSAPRPGPGPGATPSRPTSSALFPTPTPATPTSITTNTGLPTRRLLTRPSRPGTGTGTDASPTKTSTIPQQEQGTEDPAVQEQARKITTQTPPDQPVDAELKAATAKWRAAGRAAAEDLFELVKGRVEGMGAEERKGRRGGWGGEWEPGGVGGGSSQAEGRGGDDEGFTMLTMLRSLNIEPELLGYDAKEGKWRD
ncbi:hypothetical protein B0T18DRAFT_477128 [Schizothecium vesticola]|uniref:Uncharacterized protein n=1 Tax=Schizothecium vesticola TaxID=314040 RepID=A0AA40F9S6_9PEZI|nr:hypothetical protein B0T18DRAFT_477128 [Schizothecium vesticola]